MAAGKPSSIRYQDARIVVNPTNLAAAYPHGGTEIGLFADVRFRPGSRIVTTEAEEYGGAPANHGQMQGESRLVLLSRGWDAELMELLPGGSKTGTPARGALDGVGGSSGLALTEHKILVVPSSESDLYVYLPAAVLLVGETAELRSRLSEEWQVALVFGAQPAAGGVYHRVRFKQDLTL